MILHLRYTLLLLLSLLYSLLVFPQVDTVAMKKLVVPLNRQLFHDNVDKEQRNALAFDGARDNLLNISRKGEVNFLVTRALTTGIDWIQYKIEKDTLLTHNKRLYYLKGLVGLLKNIQQGWRSNEYNPASLPGVVEAYDHCLELDEKNISIESYVKEMQYEIAAPVVRSAAFDNNPGIVPARQELILKYCLLHPSLAFTTLRQNPDMPFADSLVRVIAKKYPSQLYSYAQSSGKLGVLIRNIRDDHFITAIVRMSGSKSGQQYFPFLDNIVNGRLSFEEVDSAELDSVQYYRLLVKTQTEYMRRMSDRDTAIAYRELADKLEKKARDVFVNTINGLHEEPDAIRFRCLQPLNANELYYLAVMSDGLIYTSSYTKGVYPLMMKRVNNHGDSLLMGLHFDRYRKFISQAAAYNTLGSFLATFKSGDATALMQAFAGNLEKAEGLEDGVDVADSYASIIETNKSLAAEILNLIRQNYQRNLLDNNERGKSIYNILYKLFLSADSTQGIDLTTELGIPPVYNVPYTALADDKTGVNIQMFFYGDKDGKVDYGIFQAMFNNKNWKIDNTNKQWSVVRSVQGKPVSIYANVPFDEETGGDDEAQKALIEYFRKNDIHPSITINRGHSYHAQTTIDYMSPSSRIVFMGSCGGFNLIDAILKKSPDAHIIASKQIGKRDINKPFLSLLTEKLRNGSNIDWIPFWKEFRNDARVEGFEDYIPPYKNLGAIFIKAYKKQLANLII